MQKLVDVLKNRQNPSQTASQITTEAQLSEDLFRAYKGSRSNWEKQAKEDEDFRRGAQWAPEEVMTLKERGQAPIVVNVIEPAVDQAKALLTTNKPKFSSTAREDSDVATGKVFSDIMAYIWDISNGNNELKQAIDDYYVKGMGVMVAYIDWLADSGKGEVKVTSEDPYNVYIDPNVKNAYVRDAAHVLVVKTMSEEMVASTFPRWNEIKDKAIRTEEDHKPVSLRHGEEYQNDTINDSYHEHYRVIGRYTKVQLTKHVLYNPETADEHVLDDKQFEEYIQQPAIIVIRPDRQPDIITDKDLVDEFLTIYQQTGGTYHLMQDPQTGEQGMMPGPEQGEPGEVPGSTIGLQIITQGDAIELKGLIHMQVPIPDVKYVVTIGQAEYSSEYMGIDQIPVVTLMNHFNRDPYPMSDVRFVRGIQEQINKIESLIIAHAANSTNVKVFLPNGSVDREEVSREFAKAGSGVIYYEASVGAPVIAGPVALPNELYKNKQDKVQEVERILGIYALMQGDSNSAPNTYKGTIALDEYGQRRIKSKKDDIEGALNVLAKVVVQLIQQVYTQTKIIRLIQPNTKAKEVILNGETTDATSQAIKRVNDITTGKYDLIVVSGSMLPSNRWALVEYYMELYKLNLIDQQSVLEKTEVADVEEVLQRIGIMQQQAQQIAGLEERIKQLEGDLQTATRESLHDKKRVEVEKFKTELKGKSTEASKAVMLYEAGLKNAQAMHEERLGMIEQQAKTSSRQI